MGGYGSGRGGGRPTTDNGLTLALSKLFRDGLFRPGGAYSGSIEWTNTTTGELVGSIGYEARLGQDWGRVRLKYTTTRWDGERLRDQPVELRCQSEQYPDATFLIYLAAWTGTHPHARA